MFSITLFPDFLLNSLGFDPPKPEKTTSAPAALVPVADCPPPHAQILIADDDPDTLLLMQMALRTVGIAATLARDGDEAFQIATEAEQNGQPFDLLILDVAMPNRSGLRVAEDLLAMGMQTPVALFTGDDSPVSYMRSRAAHIVKTWHKPANPAIVAQEVNTFLAAIPAAG